MITDRWEALIPKTRKIKRNAIRCKICGDEIESVNRHDFVWCSCGAVYVDGGRDYLIRGYRDSSGDFEELTEYENV